LLTAPRRSLYVPLPVVVLLGVALVLWPVLAGWMQGMDGGPGTDLGTFGWYVGFWLTMSAAMMLPSAAPTILTFTRVAVGRAERGRAYVSPWIFVAGYLGAWLSVGVVAFVIDRLLVSIAGGVLAWDRGGPVVAGVTAIAAGLYELTPLKRACLRHCRTPLQFVMHGWHEGRLGALRMGLEHGLVCIGCCAGLMVILFVLGVMSVLWMAIIAGVIAAQKLLPFGVLLTRAVAVALVVLGLWIALAPDSVPGLTDPSSGMMTPM
jgi:predicted metal-binding membrane protein